MFRNRCIFYSLHSSVINEITPAIFFSVFLKLCTFLLISSPDAEGVCCRCAAAAQRSALLRGRKPLDWSPTKQTYELCSGVSGWSRNSSRPQATPQSLHSPQLLAYSLGFSWKHRLHGKENTFWPLLLTVLLTTVQFRNAAECIS